MPRRVRRPADKENIFNSLTEGENAVFRTYKDLMVCAACIGFAQGRRKAFDKTLEAIGWHIFNGSTDVAIINAIALAEVGEFDILLDTEEASDQKLTIFEEYANGGLEVIQQRVLEAPGGALNNMIAYISEYSPNKAVGKNMDILEQLAIQIRE